MTQRVCPDNKTLILQDCPSTDLPPSCCLWHLPKTREDYTNDKEFLKKADTALVDMRHKPNKNPVSVRDQKSSILRLQNH